MQLLLAAKANPRTPPWAARRRRDGAEHMTRDTGPFTGPGGRTRLLAAAVALIAEDGYAATDPPQIARAAGLLPWHFYRYFDSEEECLLAAYDRALAWLGEQLEPGAEGGADWPHAVVDVVERVLGLFAEHPDLARFCAWDFPRSSRASLARHQLTVERLADALRAGRRLCSWSAEMPALTEEIMIGGAIWLLGYRAHHGEVSDLSSLAPEIAYCLLVPYLDIDEARRAAAPGGFSLSSAGPS
jgi:AcrR family transcriptional regulator